MQYQKILPGIFLSRPNRFVARVEVDGAEAVCHVKNTGRCRELLVPGARIYLEACGKPGRKTDFDLIAVEKGERLINMDAQAPNRVFGEWARAGRFIPGLTLLRPETTFGGSRFDFYWEAPGRRGFVEVKGVTLENLRWGNEDAPMEDVIRFQPNDRTHPAFGQALRAAAAAGVEVLALDCRVAPDRLELNRPVPVEL